MNDREQAAALVLLREWIERFDAMTSDETDISLVFFDLVRDTRKFLELRDDEPESHGQRRG